MTKKRSIFIVTIVTIFLLLLQTAPTFAADIDWPNPGAIHLDKTATPLANDEYAFKITLSIDGKNIVSQTPTNVVLVLDESGSMVEDDRMDNAKAAAKELIDILQPNSASKISIAAISFSENVVLSTSFYDVTGKNTLKGQIDGIAPVGGTNIQAGIKAAKDMLAAKGGNGIIIVLSDGQPTYSFKPVAAEAYSGLIAVNGITCDNFKITEFDYTSQVGVGSSYYFSTSSLVTVNGYEVGDNGIATISEAIFAKDAGIEIFSVSIGNPGGFSQDVPAAMEYVMKNIATDSSHAVTTTSEDLIKTFTDIAVQIAYAAENGVVTDKLATIIGYPTDLAFAPVLDGSLPYPAVSQGTLESYDDVNNQFIWHTDKISEGTQATLTYYVKTTNKLISLINDGTIDPSKTTFPTNEKAVYDYTDVNGDQASKLFPIPRVALPNTRGMVYAVFVSVNEKGEYLDASGNPLIPEEQGRPELALELGRKQIINDVDNNLKGTGYFILGNTYNIKLPADHGLIGYKPYGDQTKAVTPKNSETFVYFGFTKVSDQIITITFIADKGGSFSESTDNTIVRTYKYGERVVAPTPVASKGYEFSKWDKAIPVYATENMTITAKFLVPGGTGIPKTGDENTYVISIISLILSIVAIPAIIVKRKKRNEV